METQTPAKLFITLVALSGLAVLGYGALHLHLSNVLRFMLFLLVAVLASRLKLKLPGLTGNMSVNLPFILIGLAEFSLPETLAVASVSTLCQSFPKGGRQPRLAQVLFNVATVAIAVGIAAVAMSRTALHLGVLSRSLLVVVATVTFFMVNTVPVAAIVSLTEGLKLVKVWQAIFAWSFPYYVLSGGVASVVASLDRYVGWYLPLGLLLLMYGTYRSFKLYFGRATAVVMA